MQTTASAAGALSEACLRLLLAHSAFVLAFSALFAGMQTARESLKHMKHLSLFLAPIAAFGALPAIAASAPSLDEVVVTASRFAAPVATINASTTVITRSEIEARQASSLADLLASAGGVNMVSNGGPLTSTSIFLRGTTNKQTLVLIDGARVNSTTAGGFDFSTLLPNDIERIEIVRGAGSVQYGSDAIGGVIQIFTRKDRHTTLSLRAGSYHTQEASLSSFIGDSTAGIGFQIGLLDSDGFNATNFGNKDRDGGTKKTASLNAHKTLGKTRFAVSAITKNGDIEYDDGLSDQRYINVSASANTRFNQQWEQVVSLSSLRDDVDSTGLYGNSRFISSRQSLSWLHNVQALGGGWVVGIDAADEHASSAGTSGYDERTYNAGAFVQSNYQFDRLDTQLGLRRDHHETFGGKTTGSATAGWQFTPAIRGYAKYATAYRAPNGNDLYYPGSPNFGGVWGCGPSPAIPFCYFGSRDLTPENSTQRELGLSYQFAKQHRASLSAYRNDVTDLIAIDFSQNGFPLINIDKAKLRGVELEVAGSFTQWAYRLNASNQFAEDTQGKPLARRPRRHLNTDISYTGFERVRLGSEVVARSSTVDFGPVAGYAIGNIYADWQVTDMLKLGLRIDNVLDKDYTQANGYFTPGRSAYASAVISL